MKTTNWLARACAVLPAALILGACENAPQPTAPDAAGPAAAEPMTPGIHPLVVLAGASGDTARVELRLHQVQVSARVSSFQGELRFDPARMTLAGGESPQGSVVAWNLVAPGRVRFAGASVDGLGSTPMVALRFVHAAPLDGGAFALNMEEVVAEGAGLENITPRLVKHARPLVDAAALR